MQKIFNFILLLLLTLSATSCGSDDFYTVEGEVQGIGTRNLRLYYYDENGMKVGVISALDGKFTFRGNAKEMTLLTIATNQRTLVTAIAVRNGDYVKLKYTLNEPWTLNADGNGINDAISSFVKENVGAFKSGDATAINAAVRKYVEAGKKDVASAVIVALYYDSRLDPGGYNALLESFPDEMQDENILRGYFSAVREMDKEKLKRKVTPLTLFCEDDSLATFRPDRYSGGSLITLTDSPSVWKDSLDKLISGLPAETGVLNIHFAQDTVLWHENMRSCRPGRGLNVWVPGYTSSPRLASLSPVGTLPEFVAVRPDGTKIYQGPSASTAISELSKILK